MIFNLFGWKFNITVQLRLCGVHILTVQFCYYLIIWHGSSAPVGKFDRPDLPSQGDLTVQFFCCWVNSEYRSPAARNFTVDIYSKFDSAVLLPTWNLTIKSCCFLKFDIAVQLVLGNLTMQLYFCCGWRIWLNQKVRGSHAGWTWGSSKPSEAIFSLHPTGGGGDSCQITEKPLKELSSEN